MSTIVHKNSRSILIGTLNVSMKKENSTWFPLIVIVVFVLLYFVFVILRGSNVKVIDLEQIETLQVEEALGR